MMSAKKNCSVHISYYIVIFSLMFPLSAAMHRPIIEALFSTEVNVNQKMIFECTLPPSVDVRVKWTWKCGSKTNRKLYDVSATSRLIFVATKDDDNTHCSCRAESVNKTYNETSEHLPITVYYVPLDPPILHTLSSSLLSEGQQFHFSCHLKYMGNPPMVWTWRCGERTLFPFQFNNKGISSEVSFEAEAWQNGLFCLCIASSQRYAYNISSKGKKITVFYAPHGSPILINVSSTHVYEGAPVTLRCHVSSGGNPPLSWSWFCGDSPLERELSFGGNWSEVTFVASKMYHQRACYCRLYSMSEKVKYDKRSQKKFITLKGGHICFSVPAFASTTGLLLGAVVIVTFVVLFRNHRFRERLLAIKMPSCTCNCFENLCKSPPRRVDPPQPRIRDIDGRTFTFIEEHTYEAVQRPRKKVKRGKRKRPPTYENTVVKFA